MRNALPLLPGALLFSCVLSCGTEPVPRARYQGPQSVVLSSAEATVTLRLDRFGMKIARGDTVVLDTLVDDPKIAGDTTSAYGSLGATHRESSYHASLIEGWDHEDSVDDLWHHGLYVARATLSPQHASLELFDPRDEKPTLHVEISVTGAEVRLDATVADDDPARSLDEMGLSFALPKDEHFFGLGERYVSMDHRGRHYQCWTEEGGIAAGEGAKPGPNNPGPNGPGMTHLPVPFLISSKGYGLWLDTSYRTGFALGSDDERAFRVYAQTSALHLHVLLHADPKETIRHFTELTGRAELPAAWVFGPRRRVDHGSMVAGIPEEEALRVQKVPTTMVDDTTHFLPIASQVGREAELADWTSRMHALGYKAIGYFNSYVSVTKPEAAKLVEYGRAHDLFVRLDDGTEFDTFMVSSGGQKVATIDLTKHEAVVWYQSLLQTALDLGYDGWMLDFGEYLPQHARLSNGMTGFEGHNAFPVIYQRATYEYLRRVRGDDFMFFARSGSTGTQAIAPVVWSGDPAASFDDAKGLPAQVRAGISAGISGIPFWGSDISGYACNADPPANKEVYLRWAAFGALSSDMHDENACAGSTDPAAKKWNIWNDAETTDVYGRYARLHTRLNPYLHAAAKEATETGLPVIRHPFLMSPQEPDALAAEFDYWFGPSLFVAPVVRRGATTRELWLPPGTWFDWWTMAPVTGGKKVTRDVPLDVIPLYLRAGGVVAMLDPSIETLATATRPEVITPAMVADVLDVRAAIDLPTQVGNALLVDGTDLSIHLAAGAPVLPAGMASAATEDELATCSSCGRIDPLAGGAVRVRITTSPTVDSAVIAGPLVLRAWRMPRAMRIRWDVVVLPGT